MIIVIQCAASKCGEAGKLRTIDGRPVRFVARPRESPSDPGILYARPDDPSDDGRTWRARLVEYNRSPETNPWHLLRAVDLYAQPVYGELERAFGASRVYVLSAGWGLVPGSYLLPDYDITLSPQAERYKRRSGALSHDFDDFRMLPNAARDEIHFVGGASYVPLFCALTRHVAARRIVHFNSSTSPEATGCELQRFETTMRTNWHYACARALIRDSRRSTDVASADHDTSTGIVYESDSRPSPTPDETTMKPTGFQSSEDAAATPRTDRVAPATTRAGETLADGIRRHVQEKYIEPARRAGLTSVVVVANDVHRDLGLKNRMPAVCSALDAHKFQEQCCVLISRRDGPAKSSTVRWEFSIA